MDVHPPHRPIENGKDFLVHLLTITVGLCIALALEALVEAVHHRHIVREAHENLHREIEDNQALYARNVASLRDNRARLEKDIEQLLVLRGGGKLDHPELNWSWSWDGYSDLAWKSARDTGALVHMNVEAVQRYAQIYDQQEVVNAGALAFINDVPRASGLVLVNKDPAKWLPGEIQAALAATAELKMRLLTLESLERPLEKHYAELLQPR